MVRLENDWDEVLAGEFEKPYYLKLREFLVSEYRAGPVYPEMGDIFNALKATAFSDVKVVILGQDPYHGAGQAHGMAFSVRPGVEIPPSLVNIFMEIRKEVGGFLPDNGYLMPWARQGVLLLNTVLTVRAGQANSHQGMGWETFTDRVIESLNDKEEPVVFLLWGRNAREKGALVKNPRHVKFEAPHPSPLSASRGFFGCGHFLKANQELVLAGMEPVDWQIPNLAEADG